MSQHAFFFVCVRWLMCVFVHSSCLSFLYPWMRNNFLPSVNLCLSPYVVACSPRAAGPPSLWRVMQLRQIPAGRLSLMPTGSSQALDTAVFHVCLSMCMSYCLENFSCTLTKTTQMHGCFQEHWPLFTSNSLPSCSLFELQCTKGNTMEKPFCTYTNGMLTTSSQI